MNTHHHWDHAGGNKKILSSLPSQIPVIGGADCEAVTKTPSHNSTFSIGKNIQVTALHTPCHTQDSICWFMEDSKTNERVVFTGDTKQSTLERGMVGTVVRVGRGVDVRLPMNCWRSALDEGDGVGVLEGRTDASCLAPPSPGVRR